MFRHAARRTGVLAGHLTQRSAVRWTSGVADNAAKYPHSDEVAVRWGDMDAYGHVNNSTYLVYLESSRVKLIDEIYAKAGLPTMSESGAPGSFSPIVGSITIKYIRPMSYPDTAVIGNNITEVTDTSLVINTKGVSKNTGQTCFVGNCKVVFIDYTTGKRVAMGNAFRNVLKGYEP
eukprot:TRINITY_DN327_c0_g4_i2.p1 TRINITY_DN327_c0_g4~~TRINITY_DN327_c0_g4_i2.p1  ORF type:complete len:176 (+),score=10.74 TRINITY_DN327_c0_g4_i2:49-576(+)